MLRTLFAFLVISTSLFAAPAWQELQIEEDLTPFQGGFSFECMLKYYEKHKKAQQLCLFTIESNALSYQVSDAVLQKEQQRFRPIYEALSELCAQKSLPDVTFIVSLHDTHKAPSKFPIFTMSKRVGDNKILFPDFHALEGTYQVIKGLDLLTSNLPRPWKRKKDCLVWRGSGVEGHISAENMHTKSRVILCQLSEQHPDLIDAGFTFCMPSCLQRYQKERLSYRRIFAHKYQIWPDGNATSYSSSGWRFLTGSPVLKPESSYTQWYFKGLEAWVNYVPVKQDLSDLVATLCDLRENPELAEQIGANGREFARKVLSKEATLDYLHDLLWAYSYLRKGYCTCPAPPS